MASAEGAWKGRRRQQAVTHKWLQLHRDIIWAGIMPDRFCKLIRDGIIMDVVVTVDKLTLLAAGTDS